MADESTLALEEMSEASALQNDDQMFLEQSGLPKRVSIRKIIDTVRDIIVPATQRDLENAVQAINETLTGIQEDIEDLQYEPIQIISFTVEPSRSIFGDEIESVKLIFSFNKPPTTAVIKAPALDGFADGITLIESDIANGYCILQKEVNRTVEWRMTVMDEREATATKTCKTQFTNYICWGKAPIPDVIDWDFIYGLGNSSTQGEIISPISVIAYADEYIWYCAPRRFGDLVFSVAGFDGGFSQVDLLPVTNQYGYQEQYMIYRSDNPGLGATKVYVEKW